MSIKLKQPTMPFFRGGGCKSSDAVEWSFFFLIH